MLASQKNIYIIVIILSLFALFFVGIIVITSVLYYNRRRAHRSEKLKFEQQLLQTQLEIREQTLREMAQELHDNLGQIASLIKINLNTLLLTDSTESEQKLKDTKELTRQLINDIKVLSVTLNSHQVVQHGLFRSLTAAIEWLKRTGKYQVSLELKGSDSAINANTSIILYRIVQEVLNNIVKHSQATCIHLRAEITENLFTLVCSDNGVGFDAKGELKHGVGSGLTNLHNRARLINATLTIDSGYQQGTSIVIDLPLS